MSAKTHLSDTISTTAMLGEAVKFKHLISLLATPPSFLLRKRKFFSDADTKCMAVSLQRQRSGQDFLASGGLCSPSLPRKDSGPYPGWGTLLPWAGGFQSAGHSPFVFCSGTGGPACLSQCEVTPLLLRRNLAVASSVLQLFTGLNSSLLNSQCPRWGVWGMSAKLPEIHPSAWQA